LSLINYCKFTFYWYTNIIRWPGSVHDSTIFDNSLLRAQFENNEFGDDAMVGDEGYACRNYMMTPVSNPITEAEIRYQVRKPYANFIKTTIIYCFDLYKAIWCYYIFRKHKLAREMSLKEHLVFGKGSFLCCRLEFELKYQLLL